MKTRQLTLLIFLQAIATTIAHAQSLPSKQQVSVRAPTDIKIDGRATEWGNKFEAYNKSTELFYILANSDDKLYLVVQAAEPAVINKIVSSGITFMINRSGNKQDNDAIAITYPFFSKNSTANVNLKNKPKIVQGSTISLMQADSFMDVNNKRMADKSKYIMVTGIETLDTLISVYNDDGIKANALFDNKMVYTYELAVDLKLLGMSVVSPVKFAYHVVVNGIDLHNMNGIVVEPGTNGIRNKVTISPGTIIPTPDQMSPTDFWGEYILAKKTIK